MIYPSEPPQAPETRAGPPKTTINERNLTTMEDSLTIELLERYMKLSTEKRAAILPVLEDILTGKIKPEDAQTAATEKLSSCGITQ